MGEQAEYQIYPSVNDSTLEVILTGKLIAGAVEELQYKILDIIKVTVAKNLLIDTRAINEQRINITQAYFAVRHPLHNIQNVKKTAFVDRPENSDIGSFIETTALNVGRSFKWFTDIDEARNWLMSK